MPIYEYECRGCGNRFETLVYGATVPACPSCSGNDLLKLISSFAVASTSGGSRQTESVGACGSCGDPRGAGACSLE
jgi:putative FmdB family regulatory protein